MFQPNTICLGAGGFSDHGLGSQQCTKGVRVAVVAGVGRLVGGLDGWSFEQFFIEGTRNANNQVIALVIKWLRSRNSSIKSPPPGMMMRTSLLNYGLTIARSLFHRSYAEVGATNYSIDLRSLANFSISLSPIQLSVGPPNTQALGTSKGFELQRASAVSTPSDQLLVPSRLLLAETAEVQKSGGFLEEGCEGRMETAQSAV